MAQELWVLVLAAIWGLVQILVADLWPVTQKGYLQWNSSARDKPFDFGPVTARLRRAYQNYLETFAFFAALVLVGGVLDHSDEWSRWGAWIYLAARVIYFPAYGAGTKLRSLSFVVSLIGMAMLAFSLIRSAL